MKNWFAPARAQADHRRMHTTTRFAGVAPSPDHPTPERVLRDYFHAKDENRPHLLARVFGADAVLQMDVRTDAISFPAVSTGLEQIADALVRRFGQSYENVYSFYLERPAAGATDFACDWLVVMSEKASGNARVGCGRYDWRFAGQAPHLAQRLLITIEQMLVLPPERLGPVLDWAGGLPYPWCTPAVLRAAPHPQDIAPVVRYLSGVASRTGHPPADGL